MGRGLGQSEQELQRSSSQGILKIPGQCSETKTPIVRFRPQGHDHEEYDPYQWMGDHVCFETGEFFHGMGTPPLPPQGELREDVGVFEDGMREFLNRFAGRSTDQ